MTATGTATPADATTGSALERLRARFGVTTTTLIWAAFAVVLVACTALVAADGQNLLAQRNIVNLLSRTSVLGFIAIGQTFVILCRSLDLSVGYTAALASIVGATTMAGDTGRMLPAVLAALAVCLVIGLVNGLVITKLQVNPFIATLGMALVVKGYLDTRYAGPVGAVAGPFQDLGYTRLGPVPLATLVMLVVAAASVLLLRRTRTGHAMYAVGGNAEAARLSGIRTDRVMVAAHILCSVVVALAGLLLAARFSTGVGAQIYGSGYDLDSIAAVVLGGTLLSGGRGGVAGTVAGVLILATLDSTFNLLQVNPFFRDVLRGVIIIGAVALYARQRADGGGRARFAPDGTDLRRAAGRGEQGARDAGRDRDDAAEEVIT